MVTHYMCLRFYVQDKKCSKEIGKKIPTDFLFVVCTLICTFISYLKYCLRNTLSRANENKEQKKKGKKKKRENTKKKSLTNKTEAKWK